MTGKKKKNNSAEPESIVVPSEDEINQILKGSAPSSKPEEKASSESAGFRWPMKEEEVRSLFEKAKERDTFLEELKKAKADMINYQNRMKKDREDWTRQAVQNICLALLTTLDNFDLALRHAGESGNDTAGLCEGIEITRSSLVAVLESYGVKPIEALGKPFDPNYHEAMFTEPVPEHTQPMVLEELQKGYMLGDWVLRAVRVKVSQPGNKQDKAGD